MHFSHVSYDDEISTIRIASFEDLEAINSYATERHWGAKWSSEEALKNQVHRNSLKFLLPVFRNAAGDTEIESLRCHIWFLPATGTRIGMASLVDVAVSHYQELRELSPDKAIPVLKRILDCYERSRID